jgi:CHRD domain
MKSILNRYGTALAVGVASVCLALSLAAQGGDTYKTRLSALPADAKTRPDLAGTGTVTATLAGKKLTVNGTFEGLKTNATMAEIRNGVTAAVRGDAIGTVTVTKAMKGTITGSIELTDPQIEHLKKGGLYVQIYTEKPTDGTLWGWLMK